MKVSVLFVCALALLALALPAVLSAGVRDLDFALRYRGPCTHDNNKSSHCKLKAQSQDVLTRIKADGSVEFQLKELIGSISHLELDVTYNFTTLTFGSQGYATFGIHQTHDKHRLDFSDGGAGKIGSTPISAYGFATTMKVLRGYGAFSQATGFISLNGVWDFNSSEAVVGVVGVVHLPGDH